MHDKSTAEATVLSDPQPSEIDNQEGNHIMGPLRPRYCKEQFARRGQKIYEERVRPQVEEGNRGRIVAIDIETGEFEMGDDTLATSCRLLERCPGAQPWLVRIGHRSVRRFSRSQPY